MLFLVALTYLLLCVRIHVRLEASFKNGQGGAALCVSMLGWHVRRDYLLVRGENAFLIRLKPRTAKKRREKQKQTRHNSMNKLARNALLNALRAARFKRVALRLSLGDACETAIAAGAARALLCAVLAGVGGLNGCDLRVTPDFDHPGLYAHAAGIFSCQMADIMLAALRAALGKRARD